MHPYPKGYGPVKDGDTIRKGDISLGKNKASCGRESQGWSPVAPYLIGQEYFANGMDDGTLLTVLRRDIFASDLDKI
jgi:hypothetical protein